jgi:hypothetical protein
MQSVATMRCHARADVASIEPQRCDRCAPCQVGALRSRLGAVSLLTSSPLMSWRKRALAAVQKIEDELEAELQGQVESYLEMMNSNR